MLIHGPALDFGLLACIQATCYLLFVYKMGQCLHDGTVNRHPDASMPRLILFLLSFLFILPVYAAEPAQQDQKTFTQFQQDIARMITVRSEAYRFAEKNDVLKVSTPKMTRAQINLMHEIGRRYLEARSALLPDAEAVKPFFDKNTRLVLSAMHSHASLVDNPAPDDPADTSRIQHYLNPLDQAGQVQMLEIQRGLAAALVLMDSYQVAVEPYAENTSLRYLLTYDVNRRQSLRTLSSNYHSTPLRVQIENAIRFVDAYMEWQRTQLRAASTEESYLYALIQSTLWYAQLHGTGASDTADALRYVGNDLKLRRQRIERMLSYGLSMGFGNMLGLVQTRRGKLAHLSSEETKLLAEELKPLDILLEKTPFRLTDKMIPGHYGHVAVWLGSEAELREMGIWEQIAPAYQQRIREGGRIVEALRGGVTISTLDHFLNIDDLLVLRDRRPLDQGYQRQAILTALEQVGKEYDFNFDVLTSQRIVCSELAYVVFPDVQWPIAQTLGRYTISPDNVAQLAINDNPTFEPTVIYHKGKRIQNALRETLAKLIGDVPKQLPAIASLKI